MTSAGYSTAETSTLRQKKLKIKMMSGRGQEGRGCQWASLFIVAM